MAPYRAGLGVHSDQRTHARRPSETLRNAAHGLMSPTTVTFDRCERSQETPFSLSSDSGTRICASLRCAPSRVKSCKPGRSLRSAGSDTASSHRVKSCASVRERLPEQFYSACASRIYTTGCTAWDPPHDSKASPALGRSLFPRRRDSDGVHRACLDIAAYLIAAAISPPAFR